MRRPVGQMVGEARREERVVPDTRRTGDGLTSCAWRSASRALILALYSLTCASGREGRSKSLGKVERGWVGESRGARVTLLGFEDDGAAGLAALGVEEARATCAGFFFESGSCAARLALEDLAVLTGARTGVSEGSSAPSVAACFVTLPGDLTS